MVVGMLRESHYEFFAINACFHALGKTLSAARTNQESIVEDYHHH